MKQLSYCLQPLKLRRPSACFLAFFLLCQSIANAQLISFSGTGNLLIPPGAPNPSSGVTESPCEVAGIGILGNCIIIDNVEINLTHTWVGEIGILLIGPGGQVLELSTGNGNTGDDYTNTVFTDLAPDFITSGAPPFSGAFKPEGRVTNLNNPYSNGPPLGTHTFANTYNGTNADGTWTLYINDYVGLDVGELISWSITFSVGSGPPVADAGPDVVICPGQNASLTASGGDSYLWSTGDQTASLSVMPSLNTTYTVTVTQAGCGSATDEVLVEVFSFTTPIITGGTVLCPGSSLVLTAEGADYTNFSWSNGGQGDNITVGITGTYTVTVTNSDGCTGTASTSITPGPVAITSIQGPGILCTGTNATLTATGSFDLYEWSNGNTGATIQVSQGNTYTVTVTNSAGCTNTASIAIAAVPSPTVSFSTINPDLCPGACTDITATFTGTAPFTLTYTTPGSGPFSQFFAGNTGTFQVCANASAPLGNFLLQAIELVDANCICK